MRARRGVSSIELALVLPVLLALILAIVDWSVYMYERLDVGVAASRGVRLAAGMADPTATATAAVCDALAGYKLACAAGTVDAVVIDRPSGPVLEVAITLPFAPPVGVVPTPALLYASATTAWYGAEETGP